MLVSLPRLLICVAPLLILVVSPDARAQTAELETSYNVERFRLGLDENAILDVESADVPGHLALSLGMWLGYADDPLNLYRESTIERERVGSLVSHRLGGELVGALSFFDRFQIGVDLPLILNQDADAAEAIGPMAISSFGIGDIRLAAKIQLLTAEIIGFDLAVMTTLGIPSSGDNDYFGDSGPTFAPELVASVAVSATLRVGANVGLLMRERKEVLDLAVDDEIYAHLGAGYMVSDVVELDGTVSTATAPGDLFGAFNRNFSELRGGLGVHLGDRLTGDLGNLVAFAAAGVGTSEGFGTPDWRVLAGVRFASAGTRSSMRTTTTRVADVDGSKAGDATSGSGAMTDTDGDGIVDDNDDCPLEAEPLNGIRDEDGCPDEVGGKTGDKDGDGVTDENDQCPTGAEDVDRFNDLDGCPDPDNDNDGVLDGVDRCPLIAGSVASQGCPPPDRDGDGVADSVDNCPDEPGTEPNAGCTDEQLVRLIDGKLDVIEKVYFLTDKSTIRPRSYRLLRNVAAVMNAHPELSKVRVEGHTDDRGSERYNQDLSDRRAEAVLNFLVSSGVDASRLESVGVGEANPIADNTSTEGQGKNRRVEFILVGAKGIKQD